MKRRTQSLPHNYSGNAFSPPASPVYRYPTQSRTAMSELSHRWFQTAPAMQEAPRPRRDLPPKAEPPKESRPQTLPAELPQAVAHLFQKLPLAAVGKEELLLATLLVLLGQAGADRETLLVLALLLWWN